MTTYKTSKEDKAIIAAIMNREPAYKRYTVAQSTTQVKKGAHNRKS